jgi:hypothetical protein
MSTGRTSHPNQSHTQFDLSQPQSRSNSHIYTKSHREFATKTNIHSMELSDFSKKIYELSITVDEESSQPDLYNCLMKISQLSQANIITPISIQNYIIDDKAKPSIIACVATSAKRVTYSGNTYSGSIFFNSDHPENLTSRIPTDLATTRNSATLLTCLVALKLTQRLGIKRLMILTRSKLLANLLNRRNYNTTHDTIEISKKLEG